ncbi:MAG: hypothetical protein K1X75_09300 [Leptospirales bacterium]|nr:hypothetical protein [Leptospirales bacterium]
MPSLDWESWPLWLDSPARSILVDGGLALNIRPQRSLPDLSAELERLDAEFAAGRQGAGQFVELARGVWPPETEQELRLRLDGRGLRYLSNQTGGPSPEWVSFQDGQELLGLSPVLRLSPETSLPTLTARVSSNTAFIYCNPGGEPPLPQAKRQAERCAQLLESRFDVQLCMRSLSEHEFYERLLASRLALYFGHGMSVQGAVAIATPQGFAPLIPAAWLGQGGPEAFLFGGCLPGGLQRIAPADCWFLHPACRLADRLDPYFEAFVSSIARGETPDQALAAGILADRQVGDCRRFAYRLRAPRNSGRSSPAKLQAD